ncbi:AraC family transcriptional regulator [Sphingobium sp.]|uniref:AraC family transcriptional regulator n=1 Tax=Sphingobium sp. TaxID=1912891 RepID=UPI002CB2615D|nr:AraC family transcriptional regulator [Sphingobium sp.]HUD92355.1 AraC family transcriptional regulator [Sphingobium sp.]
MSERSSPSLSAHTNTINSHAPRHDEGGADVHAAHLLGLLTEAQQLLHDDPGQAQLCLDRVCRLLRQGVPMSGDPPAFVLPQPGSHRPPPTGGLASWQLRKVTSHVENRLGRNLSMEELALVASLSPGHFCRAFKISMGETPHAYVIRQRIRRAQTLMLETGQSLSDIASACGLTDQAHLTRLFKRWVGTTPMLWRRTWQSPAVGGRA